MPLMPVYDSLPLNLELNIAAVTPQRGPRVTRKESEIILAWCI